MLRVAVTAFEAVCTSSVPDLTSTCSVSAPISRLTGTFAGCDPRRRTSFAMNVLKPARVTFTV